jgi:serine/threonine protein kinase
VDIIFKCTKAIDYAHRQGVIHRDIKPSNIIISKKGAVKITDFSIAMVEASDSTQPMGLIGSVRYMSPEQLREEPLTPQTDIFSLGVVMYELLAGASPFPGESAHAVIYKVINEEPDPLSKHRRGVPEALEAIIKRALEKDLKKRYQTGLEFASELSVAFSHLRLSEKEIGQQEKFNALQQIKFFRDFTSAELEEVIKASLWTNCSSNKHIITEGEIDDSFYIIVSGRVMVRKHGRPLAVLEKGDCFGEMAYLGRTERTASIVALSDVMLMKINASLMDRASSPTQLRFYKVFVNTLIKRLTKTSELLSQTGNVS